MKKFLFLLSFIFLVACGQSVGNVDTAVIEETSTPQPETNSDSNEPAAESVNYPIAGSIDEAAQVRDSDWVKGTSEPLVSIIEYGDFQ